MPFAARLHAVMSAFATCSLLLAAGLASAQVVKPTLPAGTSPVAIAIDPALGRLYVANDGSNDVTALDLATGGSTPIAVGTRPNWLAVNPETHKVYVGNMGSSDVSVILGQSGRVSATLATGGAGWSAINPYTNKAYVIRFGAGDEFNIIADEAYVNSAAIRSYQPVALALNPVTNVIYIVDRATGDLAAIDISVDALYPTLLCPDGAGGFKPSPGATDPDPGPCINVPDTPVAVAVNPVTNKIYAVSSSPGDQISVVNGVGQPNPHTFSSLTPPGIPNTEPAKAIAVNPVTNRIYVAFESHVVVVNGQDNSMTVLPTTGAVAVGVNVITNRIYVPGSDGSLLVIDGDTNTTRTLAIPAGARAIAIDPVRNFAYVLTDSGVVPVQGAAGDAVHPVPLTATITPLPGNSASSDGSVDIEASGTWPGVLGGVRRVYYRLDSLDGSWTAATGTGPYTATFSGLATGSHTLYAFATNGLDAPSIMTDLQNNPIVGNVASYSFTVASAPAPVDPAISLSSSGNPVREGAAVTFTASVTGSAGTPTGTMEFRDGSAPIAGCSAAALASGAATCTTMALAPGPHSITAAYSGSTAYNAGTSAALAQNVIAATPRATDMNGDGKSDLVWWNGATGEVYRMLMNGLAIAGGAFVYTEPNTAWRIVADADFDGDGVTDLLWRNGATGQVYWMPFSATGSVRSAALVYSEPNTAWKIVHAPDLDGDGKADLLWWNSSSGQVYAMLMDGAAIKAQGFVTSEPDTGWRIVAVGDFDGRGKHDQLLWRHESTGAVAMSAVTFSGGAFGTTARTVFYQEPDTAWKIVGAADFDGDGRTDILWRNDATGRAYSMLMNGTTIASQRTIYVEPNLAWKIVAQADYDGDGRADILWRNDSTGQVYMMLMHGLTIASQAMVYREPDTAWRVMGAAEYAR